jgi:hypothetical protein
MANQIPGKQLSGVLKPDVAVPWTVAQDANSQRLTNLGTPTAATDAARLQDIYNVPEKQICRLASTGNLSLTGAATVDGSAAANGDRILAKDQTDPKENGIYNANTSGAWTRAADADSSAELNGALVSIQQGTLNADTRWLQTTPNPVIGTDAIVWIEVGGPGAISNPSTSNKAMTASVTSADFQVACSTPLAATPAGHSYVGVNVNGVAMTVGNGTRSAPCYFSGDGGATARSWSNLQAGDQLYWVGSVALWQLATTDTIDFMYNV